MSEQDFPPDDPTVEPEAEPDTIRPTDDSEDLEDEIAKERVEQPPTGT